MKTALSISQLESEFLDPEFILKTQRQIVKDFYSSGIRFGAEFEIEALSYLEIIDKVGEQLSELMTSGEQPTLQLLYQIDIPQSDFLALTTDPEFISKMSELIIKREAYKVYLRARY